MNMKKIVQQSIIFIGGGSLIGCVSSSSLNLKETGLSQERLFFNENSFVLINSKPSIPYSKKQTTKGISVMGVGSSIIGTIAPQLIDTTIDIVGNSIIALSGKNDKTSTIEAESSNFFYKNEAYNVQNNGNPEFNILFVSAAFGESRIKWEPKTLDSNQKEAFNQLNLVAKPNFYMEAKIFPVPGNKYMEIVPTYMFYNKQLNEKGNDDKRDLELHFSFYDLHNSSQKNLISEGSIVFKDVMAGKEYGFKELANTRTTFIKTPTISDNKKGYSGAYNLKVRVTETRDINKWLVALGETILGSKSEIASKIYVNDEEKIRLNTNLEKAKNKVAMVEAKLKIAQTNGIDEVALFELKNELIDVKAAASIAALKAGK